MSAVVDHLIEISVYAAVITACILLFRLVFHRVISPRLQYLLWAVLIARLLIPITVESGFHLPNLLPARTAVIAGAETPAAPAQPELAFGEAPGDANVAPATPVTAPETAAVSRTPGWRQIAFVVWAAGALTALLCTLLLRLRFLRRLRRSRRPDSPDAVRMLAGCREALGIKGRVRLVTTSLDLSPALTLLGGRNLLILPDRLADRRAMRYALLHELSHYRSGDQYTLLLMSALRIVYWFNPVLYYAFSEMRADMETARDAQVLRMIEPCEKRAYLMTLLHLFNRQTQPSLGFAQMQTRRLARKRMKGAFMKRKTNLPACLSALILTLALLAGCFTTACQKSVGGSAATPGNAAATVLNNDIVEVEDRSGYRYVFQVVDRGPETDDAAKTEPRGPVVTPTEAAKNTLELMAAVFDGQLSSSAANVYFDNRDGVAMERYSIYVGGRDSGDAYFQGVCDASTGQALLVRDLRPRGESMRRPKEWSFDGYDNDDIMASSLSAASALVATTLAAGRTILEDSYVDGVQATFYTEDPIVSEAYLYMDGGDCYSLSVRYPSLTVESVCVYPLGWEYCRAGTWFPEYLTNAEPLYVTPDPNVPPMPTPTLAPGEDGAVEISDEDYRLIALTAEAMLNDEFTAADLGRSADAPFWDISSAWLDYVLSDTLGLAVRRAHARPLDSLDEGWLKPGMLIRFSMDGTGYLGFYLGSGRVAALTNAEIHEVQLYDLATLIPAGRATDLHAAVLYQGLLAAE